MAIKNHYKTYSMKKIFYCIFICFNFHTVVAQIPDPCTGGGASQPISTASPCNCSEAQAGTSCTKSIFATQLAADNAIHTFLTTQSGYALPTTPITWQDVRSNNMYLDGTAGGGGIIKHEFSTEITTGASTTVMAVLNICQVQFQCNAVCQDYKIIPKSGGTCGTNTLTPALITSTLDASVQYRQYTVSPNTTYIVSRQIYYDGNDIDCYFSWTGTDGIASTGAKITAQHWFIWSTGTLPVKIVSFNGFHANNNNILEWQTENEINAATYEIESSADAKNFTSIKSIAATNAGKYLFTDEKNYTASIVYYRLKQTDRDGKFNYSKTISLRQTKNQLLAVYPNPVNEDAQLKLFSETSAKATINIFTPAGNSVYIKNDVQLKKGINSIPVSMGSLAAGVYIIKATTQEGFISSIKISKQ